MMLRHRWFMAALVSTTTLMTTAAYAQKETVAEALFTEGKRLMSEGKYAEACGKLAESQKLDPGAGSLTALALCHKAEGKLASSWVEFKEVLSLARKDGRKDREQVAQENIAEIEPKLSKLRVSLAPDADIRDLEVRLDDVVLSRAAFGQLLPIDAGPHKVTARAPSRTAFETSVVVEAERDEKTITVPLLHEAPVIASPQPAPSQPPERPVSTSSTQKLVGYGLGGVGLIAAGIGGVFGVRALSLSSDANDVCPQTSCADASAREKSSDAVTAANLSNVLIGAGVVLVVAGVVLILTSPSGRSEAASLLSPSRAKTRTPSNLRFGTIAPLSYSF